MFHILAPLWKWYDVENLIQLGANEFYFWVDFTKELNKRDNEKAQISIQEAQSFLKLREKYSNVRFFVALNEAPITWDDKKIMKKLQQLLSLIDPDAFIVRDLSVINALKEIKKDVKLHISSLAQVWNEDAISFFVDFLWDNFEKFIFPRDITWIEAVKLIKKFPQLEFEIFALNEWCWNVDGFCSSLRWTWRKYWVPFICHREYAYPWDENLKKIIYGRTSCKVCNFWKFKDLENIISVKIVWRWAEFEQIQRNVKYLKSLLNWMELADDYQDYKNFCKASLQKVNKANWCSICEFN